jgi:hypothetical protein
MTRGRTARDPGLRTSRAADPIDRVDGIAELAPPAKLSAWAIAQEDADYRERIVGRAVA